MQVRPGINIVPITLMRLHTKLSSYLLKYNRFNHKILLPSWSNDIYKLKDLRVEITNQKKQIVYNNPDLIKDDLKSSFILYMHLSWFSFFFFCFLWSVLNLFFEKFNQEWFKHGLTLKVLDIGNHERKYGFVL